MPCPPPNRHGRGESGRLIRLVGAERVALGTDYPFPLGEQEPGRLVESLPELSAAARERLLAGTAREFLRI